MSLEKIGCIDEEMQNKGIFYPCMHCTAIHDRELCRMTRYTMGWFEVFK